MTTHVPHVAEQSPSEDSAPLRELRLRLIAFETLSLPLKILTGLTVSVLVFAGVLLASSNVLSPQILTDVTADGHFIQEPLAVYLFTSLAMFLGWCCVFVASLRIHIAPRLALCLLAGVILGSSPALRLYSLATHPTASGGLRADVLLPAAQMLALVGLISWVVTLSALRMRNSARGAKTYATVACVGVLLGLYYAADILTVSAYDPTSTPQHFIPSSLAAQSTLLPGILAIVIYWGSTDFIEWGETFASNAAAAVSRWTPVWMFFSLVTLSAAIFVADTFRRINFFSLLPSLVTASILILVVLGVMRLVRVSAAWPDEVPIQALIAGAIFLFLFVQVSLAIVLWISAAIHMPSSAINPFYSILSVSLALIFLGVGALLIIRGRHTKRLETAATGLFFALVALLVISLSIPSLANVFGLPVIREIQPNIADFKIVTGVAIVCATAWLALRKRLTPQVVKPFTMAFMLLVGLQVIGWYFQLFLPSLYALSQLSTIIAAIIFIAAILWDVVTSGTQVTNRESPAFPRSARLLLYFGYALFACATFLYATSQHFATTGQAVPLPPEGISLEVVGAEGLGLPLLAFTFTQRMRQWRNHQNAKENSNA